MGLVSPVLFPNARQTPIAKMPANLYAKAEHAWKSKAVHQTRIVPDLLLSAISKLENVQRVW
jgi:hypothetical protein